MRPVRAYSTLAAIFAAGFVAFGWSWHGAKHARYVPLQLPWVLSGGLAGIALVGLSVVSWHIYVGGRDDQRHRSEWDTFTKDLADILNR